MDGCTVWWTKFSNNNSDIILIDINRCCLRKQAIVNHYTVGIIIIDAEKGIA